MTPLKRDWSDVLLWCVTLVNSAALVVLSVGMATKPTPGPGPNPQPNPPAVDAVTLGHGYGAVLAKTYASAWRKAADDVDAGKTMTDVESNMKATWEANRITAFRRDVAPMFATIIPANSEGDTTSRPKWSKAARDFADGLEAAK